MLECPQRIQTQEVGVQLHQKERKSNTLKRVLKCYNQKERSSEEYRKVEIED
jgi:hypothetical protein